MKPQQPEALQIRLERRIPASPDRVFAAWTQPELLRQWSSPEGTTVEGGELDVRVGGRWRFVLVERNGTKKEAFGIYREVTPPKRLIYTHAWVTPDDATKSSPETVVTVEFHADAGATRVVLTQVGFGTTDGRDGHRVGWSSSINRLEALFADKS